MLKGRSFHEAAIITSRICGICSLGHQMCSLQATEEALGLEISEQTLLLRKLLTHGATLQSNVLHAYFLAAPDLLGVGSVFPLVGTHPEVVVRALRMKRLANDIGDVVSGRAVHPITPVPGGFTRIPTEQELLGLKTKLVEEMVPDFLATVETMEALAGAIPNFTRETEFISLRKDDEYALYDGDICSSDTGTSVHRTVPQDDQRVRRAPQHQQALQGQPQQLHGGGPGALEQQPRQAVRCGAERGQGAGPGARLLQPVHEHHRPGGRGGVLRPGSCGHHRRAADRRPEERAAQPGADQLRYGRGVHRGAPRHSVPRVHLRSAGAYREANCIIPTGQNLANIDDDMKKLVPEIIEESKEDITLKLEMLVRAYDPCISCSVHMLDVDFIE